MKDYPQNSKLQELACSAIKVIGASERTSEHLVELGAATLILLAMKNHKYNEKLQKAACAAVWALCLTDKNKVELWNLGLGHFIIEAMNMHPKMERLQEYACGSLWTFEYPHCMMRLFAHEPVLKAMKTYKKNENIVSSGCGLIRKYAVLKSNAEELCRKEAPRIIIECLNEHVKAELQEAGCMAIWSLGILDSNKIELMEQGARGFLVRLIVMYNKNQKLFATACGTITNLSTKDENARLFLEDEVGKLVIQGAMQHKDNLLVQTNALSALKNLAFVWKEKEVISLKEAGIERLVNDAIALFPNNRLVNRRGNEILNKLNLN